MARERHHGQDEAVFTYIAEHPGTNQAHIAADLSIPVASVSRIVGRLTKKNLIQSGLNVSTEYRTQLFKSFIFINTAYRGPEIESDGENEYQQQLAKSIQEKIKSPAYSGSLFLESVEIVMGASFDIILILYAPNIVPIGNFVTKFLRSRRDVEMTQTITVWPSQPLLGTPDPLDDDSHPNEDD